MLNEVVNIPVESTSVAAMVFSLNVIRSLNLITSILFPSAPGAVPLIVTGWDKPRNGKNTINIDCSIFIVKREFDIRYSMFDVR
jgi:hypothetical protein